VGSIGWYVLGLWSLALETRAGEPGRDLVGEVILDIDAMLLSRKFELSSSDLVSCFERSKRNMMRVAIRPRAITPPTTPPIIAGVLLGVPVLTLLPTMLGDDVGIGMETGVLEGGARVDSAPFIL